ncbi:MAG: (d)CMP kinase [Deltaproteobacteria bacterium]|jgi:cytidylate kinase|nr:(d)CMP kinase [Deltaproteobacteria bacterium]
MDETDVITIDGPAGAGKSTASKRLAAALGWRRLDTGALYRAVAVAAREAGLSPDDAEAAGGLAESLALRIETAGDQDRVFLGAREISSLLRSPEVSLLSSRLSAFPQVRTALLGLQRRLGAAGGLVAEGRDMGTIVFPRAKLKFFLEADLPARAARRQAEMRQAGREADLDALMREMSARDMADSSRETAPLRRPEAAVVVDSSGLTPRQVEELMLREAARAFGWPSRHF